MSMSQTDVTQAKNSLTQLHNTVKTAINGGFGCADNTVNSHSAAMTAKSLLKRQIESKYYELSNKQIQTI